MLPQLEKNGWKLDNAVHRIWAGERDVVALTAGLDPYDVQLVRRALQLISQ
jgi:hypothetical protein